MDYTKHYIRLKGIYIDEGFTDAFEQPIDGDICINTEEWDRHFMLFKNGETNPRLLDFDKNVHLYKYVNGEILQTTDEDKLAEQNESVPLDTIKIDKITELSEKCNKTITMGVDVTTAYGEGHYSLEIYDQIELQKLATDIITSPTTFVNGVPYHADNTTCVLYTVEDFTKITQTAFAFVLYHRTYFNQLKEYIKTLEDKSQIQSITYGTELTGVYAENLAKILAVYK